MLKATVYVTKKESVLDPQVGVIEQALRSMNIEEVGKVSVGKTFELTLETTNREQAEALLKEICEKLLTNPVVEDYRYELEEL